MKRRNLEVWGPEVKYEAMLRNTSSYPRYVRATDVVYKFLKGFPDIETLNDITSVDCADWLVLRGRQCPPRTLNDERMILMQFFSWLITEGFVSTNPFRGTVKVAEPLVRVEFSFAQLQKLVATDCQEAQRKLLQMLLADQKPSDIAAQLKLHPSTVRLYWNRLRTAADFPPVPMKHFHQAYKRLCTHFGEQHLWNSLDLQKPLSSAS